MIVRPGSMSIVRCYSSDFSLSSQVTFRHVYGATMIFRSLLATYIIPAIALQHMTDGRQFALQGSWDGAIHAFKEVCKYAVVVSIHSTAQKCAFLRGLVLLQTVRVGLKSKRELISRFQATHVGICQIQPKHLFLCVMKNRNFQETRYQYKASSRPTLYSMTERDPKTSGVEDRGGGGGGGAGHSLSFRADRKVTGGLSFLLLIPPEMMDAAHPLVSI